MKKLLFGPILLIGMLFVNCTSTEDTPVFGDIYGTVTDSKSGEPIRNVEIILSPGNKTTVSGSNGHFEFKSLEAGQYKIGVEADGYEYNSRQITVVPGQRVTCDFRLAAIEIAQVLKIRPTSLNFETTHDEMLVTITNEGSEGTDWSVELGDKNWLVANPKSGRIEAGKSQTIVFAVKRDLVTEEKSAVVNIAAFGSTSTVSVSCSPKKVKGELSVSPTSLDFGEDSSELQIKIVNAGDGDLDWTISDLSAECLSVSDQSGTIKAEGNKIVKVKLDRNKLQNDLSTSFVVSDGTKEQAVSVTAKKKILKAEMKVSPTSLDFGLEVSQLDLAIENTGDADLNWKISDLASYLSASANNGKIPAGGKNSIRIILNRSAMPESVNTAFSVSDGTKSTSVSVSAAKGHPIMSVSPASLDFGETETSKSFVISNTGTADLNWSLTNMTMSCLSFSATSGRVSVGDSTTITVSLNRSAMPESVNTAFSVSDGAKSTSVSVSAAKGHPVMSVSPASLDFGETETSKSFVISNTGTADLNWSLTTMTTNCLSFSAKSGRVSAGGSTTITVSLDRSIMPQSLNTSVGISDGTNTRSVEIKGTKIIVEDYSSATVISCDSRIKAEIVSCKRSGSSVVFTYKLTNKGVGMINDWRIYTPNSMSLISGGYRSVIYDNIGTEYSYPKFTFRSANAQGSNVLNTAFPEDVPCMGTVTLSDVPDAASEITVMLGVYAYPDSTYNLADKRIYFKNVPIF